jgi:hypothetical protein
MGENRTTPQYIVIAENTNSVELVSQTYLYGATPKLEIRFNILDSAGSMFKQHIVTLTGQDFLDFVSGFGSTMYSRGDTAIWQYIQANYTTQATP